MFHIILDSTIFPVAPKKITTTYSNKNKVYNLLSQGEINVIKKAGLTSIEFELLLPQVKYPFAYYDSGFRSSEYYLNILQKLKESNSPFSFMIIRYAGDTKKYHTTSLKVSLENYTITEDASNNSEPVVNIKLKQYTEYSTKPCSIVIIDTSATTQTQSSQREQSNSPEPSSDKSYTVVSGDCLWDIAKKFYGDGSKYTKIFNANKDKISNPDLIFPGQVLCIPSSS